jgi:hypothetical protein
VVKKVFIFILTFILVGELMTRFDKSFLIMEERRVVKIPKNIELTPEYELLQKNSFTPNQEDFKIMVIGDSYIYGGGIEFEDNFSQNLKRMINSKKGNFENGWVLDVSKPSSNNLDNNQTYFEFVNRYNPDIVIIGYNLNDIEGNLQKIENNLSISDHFKDQKRNGAETNSLIQKIYKILYTSEFIQFIFHKTHNQLKAHGVVIPGSQFDLMLKSYWQNRDNWQRSKILLKEIIEHAKENEIQLIIYKFPEMDLIEYPNLFAKSNATIKSFFNEFSSVYFIDGSEQFKNKKSADYRLSKYDGHPNEIAHKKIAERVFDLIKETSKAYNTGHK